MQSVCNALYLHSSMNHKIQGILQFRLGVYMHLLVFFLSFSLVFISDIVDGIRRVGRRFDSYRHML